MTRLDYYMVLQGISPSRNIAQAQIKAAKVLVDGRIITKPSHEVPDGVEIHLEEEMHYVGRAAYKLKAFLLEHPIDIADKAVLDVGASTGGFSQVLLEYAPRAIVALDVGHGQLHPDVAGDTRVTNLEGQDIRTYEHEPFDVVTCDVAFISLQHVIYALDKLSRGDIVMLFKPQFEVGKLAKRNKQGVVTDMGAIELAMRRFEDACALLGWRHVVTLPSHVEGKEGNREFFYHYHK